MAYNPGIEQDDEQQAQGADDAGTNQLGGGSGVITGQTSGQAQKQKGSGFVNIGQYLGANQQDLSGQTDKAISKVNEGWNSANEKLATSKSGFDTAADQNRVTLGDTSTTEDDKEYASTFLKDSKLGSEDAGKFASWQNMSYQGPTELQDTWSADQKKSDDLASTLSNPNGYFPAMDEIFGNGRSDYTAGSQRLDASLMAADKTGQERINQNTAQQQAALGSSINAAQQSAQQKAQQYQTEAQSGKDAAWEALNDYIPGYSQGLVDQVAATNAARRSEYEGARQGGGQTITGTTANTQAHQMERGVVGVDALNNVIYGDVGYVHPDQLSYSYVDPTRANYVTYGGDVGLGSLDQESLAKLEALYGLTGDEAARQQFEQDAASTLGFSDIMRNGASAPAYTFDQGSYDMAQQQAIEAAIRDTIQKEIEAEDTFRSGLQRAGSGAGNTTQSRGFTPGQTFIG